MNRRNSRRDFLSAAAAGSAALALPFAARAQAWPAKPIRFVVPLPPGGSYDYLARVISEPLQRALGQPVVVENRVGADGRIGADYVARQPADGYTILIIAVTHVIHPSLFRKIPYDILKDFQPVGMIADAPFVLVVNPSVQARNPREYVELARSRPGAVTFGSSGVGSPYHLGGEYLKTTAGIDMLHVPYKGTGPLIGALMSGEVMSAFAPLGPFLPHIRSGKLRALGAVTERRATLLPDLPTINESLGLRGFSMDGWLGVVAPAGTPRPVVERLSAEISKTVKDPVFARDKLIQQGYELVGSSPEEMSATMQAHFQKYAKIIQDAKIPAE